ncbi:MAG: DUF488 domain-containing protein [Chloroflexi bacterium]|nr:DUF488 domain-containing protein [Chloroflexota bacterium]
MILYTAGHSTAELSDFVDLMTSNAIELVVDVRSKPRSRLPHFDQLPLEAAIEASGIRYRFLGERLGGMPQDQAMRDRWRQGHLDPIIVGHLRATEEWQDGIAELVRLITRGGGTSVCVICSEANPDECHRKAIALDAAQAIDGLEIIHLAVNKQVPAEVGVQEVMM